MYTHQWMLKNYTNLKIILKYSKSVFQSSVMTIVKNFDVILSYSLNEQLMDGSGYDDGHSKKP